MSRFNVMPRAYRRQLEAEDLDNVNRAVGQTYDEAYGPDNPRRPGSSTLHGEASPGRLRGIPAIGPNCPGHIRNTDPQGTLLRNVR